MKKKKIAKVILIFLLITFLVFSVVSFVIVKMNFDEIFHRTEPAEYSVYLRYDDVKADYAREEFSFESGKNTLQGYLYGAENTKGLVVISHGMGGGAESYMAEALCFVDNGYQVFGFDNTGCYKSEGDNSVGLSQSVLDLDAALTYIENQPRFEGLPVLLYGHSWGGYAVTAIFNFEHNIAASVSVAGFNKPMPMIIEWAEDMMGGFAYVEQPYIYLYQRMLFGKNLSLSALDGINSTDTPVMLIHGSEDLTISPDGPATVAQRDKITNPNARIKICDGERQNGHGNLFMSLAALDYIEELDEEYVPLYDSYDGEIPDDVAAEFYAKVDKFRASELDENFMKAVLDFYADAVK